VEALFKEAGLNKTRKKNFALILCKACLYFQQLSTLAAYGSA